MWVGVHDRLGYRFVLRVRRLGNHDDDGEEMQQDARTGLQKAVRSAGGWVVKSTSQLYSIG